MKDYETVTEALTDLKKRGYEHDFQLKPDKILCDHNKLYYEPNSFNVQEVYRFEGMTDPGDSSVIYVIETTDGLKGTLTDAYGTYATSLSQSMVEKLSMTYDKMP